MHNKYYRAALIGVLLLTLAEAKRTRRIKPTKPEEDSSPQPSVVSYSTFGFNDVGSYDGFVPSSPDYVNYLNNAQQDASPTRLYAPAFPSSPDSSGFGSNLGSQSQDQTSGTEDNGAPGMLQYNSAKYFSPGELDNNDKDGQNSSPEEKYRRIVDEESNSPVYGTKLGGNRNRHKPFNPYNDSVALDVYSSGPSNPSEPKYSNFKEAETTQETKSVSYGESASSHQNIYSYAPTYPPTQADEVVVTPSNNTYRFNFPKVIDYTKYKQYYPTEAEQKFPSVTYQQPVTIKDTNNNKKYLGTFDDNENRPTNNYESQSNNFNYQSQNFKNTYKVNEEDNEEEEQKPTLYTHIEYPNNFVSNTNTKSSTKGSKPYFEYKDKIKFKPLASSSQNNSFKNFKNPENGYHYSTDYSNMSFKYDSSPPKKHFNSHTDELTPASSNVIDLTNYKSPEFDYSNFKKIPSVKTHYDDDYTSLQAKYKELFKTDDYINQFKNLYSHSPTTSSQWGNVYKGPEFTSHKHTSVKSPFSDEISSDIVHIPKKLYGPKFGSGKYTDNKPSDWLYQNKYRPQKANKPKDWTKDVSLTRFKSEEDLLGLRTHDTSHPSYLPSYKPFNDVSDEFDYKKLVEKWRQSYLKSKYKEALRDYETYASEAKPVHVPIPKPYAIEVPRPVIVPVPEPYPVRVPVPKPVAVPIVKELTVEIEKPVPYPVYKKVPYPVEKPVPVTVVKKVPVPVLKPYPVPVPHVRPVFHHTQASHEDFDGESIDEDDDYFPRPDSYRNSKKVPYAKRPRGTRYRGRRPTRPTYQDRNRRRWPERRPTRPYSDFHTPLRSSFDEQEFKRSDYYLHCKRTGNC